MKKYFLLLAALVPFMMVSCEKSGNGDGGDAEEGNNEIPGIAGKALVKKKDFKGTLAYIDNDDEDYYDYYNAKDSTTLDATMNFTYTNGLMTSLAISGTCDDIYDRERAHNEDVEKYHAEAHYSGSGNMAFNYQGDVLSINVTAQGRTRGSYRYDPDEYNENEDWNENGSVNGTYTFNMANGAVTSGIGTFKSEEDNGSLTTEKVIFKYDNENQLNTVYYEDTYEDRVLFKWENGNIVNLGWDYDYDKSDKKNHVSIFRDKKKTKAGKSIEWDEDYRVEYSSQENKCNVDFAYIAFCYAGLRTYEQLIGTFGFCGKESKNLPSKIYDTDEERDENRGEYVDVEELLVEIKYDFNGDGTVKRVTLSSPMDVEGKAEATIELAY